jgi:ribonuclease VapC
LILDSSAVVSVILEEEGHARLVGAMAEADNLAIGAPTLLETGMVMIGSIDLHGRALVSQFLEQNRVIVIPFDGRHWSVAAEAFIRYGKGRHPAALNYGDCMTYATARLADHPLLFTGDDFAKTDLQPAV